MTTETACLSSIWETDDTIANITKSTATGTAINSSVPAPAAYYDRLIEIDLSTIEPMIALPFTPPTPSPSGN